MLKYLFNRYAQADIVTFGRIAGQQSYIYAVQADKAAKK